MQEYFKCLSKKYYSLLYCIKKLMKKKLVIFMITGDHSHEQKLKNTWQLFQVK